MGANSKIEWTDHTFNPWRGCTKVSDGCKHCYAETLSSRNPKVLGVWGPRGTRVLASESMWREPLKWNEEAKQEGVRKRVFCASLADVFEGIETCSHETYQTILEGRERLFHLARKTNWLDWLFLTKRPQNIPGALAAITHPDYPHTDYWTLQQRQPRPNWWFGTSVENQKAVDERIPELLKVPAPVRFLSCEPLLGKVNLLPDIGAWCSCGWRQFSVDSVDRSLATIYDSNNPCPRCGRSVSFSPRGIHWVIAGGESGANARPMHPNWVRSLRDQCQQAEVPFHFKQWGSWAPAKYDSYWAMPVEGCSSGFTYIAFGKQAVKLDEDGNAAVYQTKERAGRLLDGRTWDEMPEVYHG